MIRTTFQVPPDVLEEVKSEVRLLSVEQNEDVSMGHVVRELLGRWLEARRAAKGGQ